MTYYRKRGVTAGPYFVQAVDDAAGTVVMRLAGAVTVEGLRPRELTISKKEFAEHWTTTEPPTRTAIGMADAENPVQYGPTPRPRSK